MARLSPPPAPLGRLCASRARRGTGVAVPAARTATSETSAVSGCFMRGSCGPCSAGCAPRPAWNLCRDSRVIFVLACEFRLAHREVLRSRSCGLKRTVIWVGHDRADPRKRRRSQATASRLRACLCCCPPNCPAHPLDVVEDGVDSRHRGRDPPLFNARAITCVIRRDIRKPPHSSAITAAASSRLTAAMMPRSTFVVVRSTDPAHSRSIQVRVHLVHP